MGRWIELAALVLAALAGIALVARLVRAKPESSPDDVSDPSYWAMGGTLLLFLAGLSVEVVLVPPLEVTPLMWVGRGVVIAGAVLTIWSRHLMGESYAPTAHHPRPDEQELIRRGPYRFLRHPQYLGNLASLAGLALALDLRWAWLGLLPFVGALVFRIRREEAYMRERFGPEWRQG